MIGDGCANRRRHRQVRGALGAAIENLGILPLFRVQKMALAAVTLGSRVVDSARNECVWMRARGSRDDDCGARVYIES